MQQCVAHLFRHLQGVLDIHPTQQAWAGTVREREIEEFYREFSEAGPDHIRQSRKELREYLGAGENLEALLVRWQHERAAQMVEREMLRWPQ